MAQKNSTNISLVDPQDCSHESTLRKYARPKPATSGDGYIVPYRCQLCGYRGELYRTLDSPSPVFETYTGEEPHAYKIANG